VLISLSLEPIFGHINEVCIAPIETYSYILSQTTSLPNEQY